MSDTKSIDEQVDMFIATMESTFMPDRILRVKKRMRERIGPRNVQKIERFAVQRQYELKWVD